MKPRYNVLRAVYDKTGEVETVPLGPSPADGTRRVQIEYVKRWEIVGQACSVEDARARYSPAQLGYGVVLEEIDPPKLDLRHLAGEQPR